MNGFLVAAPHSGSGKTTVTLGLLRALRDRGVPLAPAKAGPDYIDPAFHEAASGESCINLDPWAMRPELLHALADALLGALALGDIGKHFPDTDEQYSGADSRVLLRHVVDLIHQHGYRLVNADMTLIAQVPKMAPHIVSMRENIAADCQAPEGAISVKATTSEKLGFTGRKEGIAAQAVVLLESTNGSAA